MKRLILAAVAVLAFSHSPLFAAGDKSEIFGGYSFLSGEDDDGDGSREIFNGWNAAYEYKLQKSVGIVGDLAGHYKSFGGVRLNAFEYTGGPRVHFGGDKTNVFAHALFGGIRTSGAGVSTSDNHFLMLYGGGLDVKASDKISIRAAEIDWVVIREGGSWDSNTFRMSFGVVFKSGK